MAVPPAVGAAVSWPAEPQTIRRPRVMLRDPELEHQITIVQCGNAITIGCNCLERQKGRGGVGKLKMDGLFIDGQTVWQPGEAVQAWRAWHEARGVAV